MSHLSCLLLLLFLTYNHHLYSLQHFHFPMTLLYHLLHFPLHTSILLYQWSRCLHSVTFYHCVVSSPCSSSFSSTPLQSKFLSFYSLCLPQSTTASSITTVHDALTIPGNQAFHNERAEYRVFMKSHTDVDLLRSSYMSCSTLMYFSLTPLLDVNFKTPSTVLRSMLPSRE